MSELLAFDVVIPVRYESSRFPGKPLADIGGKTMIHRVIECAQKSSAQRVIVAVEDVRIEHEVKKNTSAEVVHTSKRHLSGTDRVAEAVRLFELQDDRIVVNVQGDEPLMPGSLIDKVAAKLHQNLPKAKVATAARPVSSNLFGANPNKVKCVVDKNYFALYFSRSQIPWTSSNNITVLHHIGIYAYTVGYLLKHSNREPCELEKTERLEQLRVLFHGDRIAVCIDSCYEGVGVDTKQDLDLVRNRIRN